MANVKIHAQSAEQPASAVLAPQEHTVTDARGRVITLKRPAFGAALAYLRLVEAVGRDAAANSTYMSLIEPLIYVTGIDGEPVPFPVSKREVEGLFQRLDEDGYAAVQRGVIEQITARRTKEEEKDAVKK